MNNRIHVRPHRFLNLFINLNPKINLNHLEELDQEIQSDPMENKEESMFPAGSYSLGGRIEERTVVGMLYVSIP